MLQHMQPMNSSAVLAHSVEEGRAKRDASAGRGGSNQGSVSVLPRNTGSNTRGSQIPGTRSAQERAPGAASAAAAPWNMLRAVRLLVL